MPLLDFSDSEADTLRAMARAFKAGRLKGSATTTLEETGQAPEVYVVKSPEGGIPGRDGAEPGKAYCPVYQDNGLGRLLNIGLNVHVKNLSTTSIPEGSYAPTTRDKFGQWYVGAVGSSSCQTIRFEVVATLIAVRSVVADIIAVPAGFTIDDVPARDISDHVIVADALGCFFNEPPGSLLGRTGWAHYMLPLEPVISQPGAEPEATVGTGTGSAGLIVPQWEVCSLCCNFLACGD